MTKGCSGFVKSEKNFCGRNLSFNDVKLVRRARGEDFKVFKGKDEGNWFKSEFDKDDRQFKWIPVNHFQSVNLKFSWWSSIPVDDCQFQSTIEHSSRWFPVPVDDWISQSMLSSSSQWSWTSVNFNQFQFLPSHFPYKPIQFPFQTFTSPPQTSSIIHDENPPVVIKASLVFMPHSHRTQLFKEQTWKSTEKLVILNSFSLAFVSSTLTGDLNGFCDVWQLVLSRNCLSTFFLTFHWNSSSNYRGLTNFPREKEVRVIEMQIYVDI
jgi:hypothetical protein